MAKQDVLDQYHTKLAEARALAMDASKDLIERARELEDQLEQIRNAYEELMGEPLPAGKGRRPRRMQRRAAGASKGGTRGKRSPLKGPYAGKTIPEAVVAVLGKNKGGLGPSEIASKIGGNRNSISVALIGMVKDGQIKRAERGKYTSA